LSWGDAIKGHMPAVASLLRSYLNEVRARLSALDARLRAAYASAFSHCSCKIQDFGARNEPIADAFVKISEGSRALMTLPERGRALVKRVPAPVQLEFKKMSSRGAHLCREIFAGVMVVGLVLIVFGYGRLGRGPISIPSLVPVIETAINGELSDLHVKIDDAVLQRSAEGPGVLFRLRNIRLIDNNGQIVAQSPLAAIGMNGSALLSGRLAPGSVDFIGPRLLLFQTADRGLALSFSKAEVPETEALRGSLPPSDEAEALPSESVATEEIGPPSILNPGKQLDVTGTIAQVFERARSGDSSYLTRFGVRDAVVVLSRDGAETTWQVPDFSIDLQHKGQRSILVGQAKVASSKGDWQLGLKTEQRSKRQSLSFTAFIQDLVPSGLVENFPGVEALKALDLPVSGETTVELSTSGEFLSGEANLQLRPGYITPPWDPESAMQIDRGDLRIRYLKEQDIVEVAPSTIGWGKSKATISGTLKPIRDNDNAIASWDFKLKAAHAVLAAEQFGLGPIKVDEWHAEGNVAPETGDVKLSEFVIRSGTASIKLAGSITEGEGSPAVHLTGAISPMPLDTLKQFWPKFMAGKARDWAGERVRGGQVLGGKVEVSLKPGDLDAVAKGGELPPDAVNVELDLAGMDITYIPKLPPVRTGDAKLRVTGLEFAVDIPEGKIMLPSNRELALREGRFFIPDLRQDPQQGEISFTADGATAAALELLDHEPLGYMKTVGVKPENIGGTAQGRFTLLLPMTRDVEFKDMKVNGSARLDNAIATGVVEGVDVQGGSLDVSVSEQALHAKGEITIKGVPATLTWERLFFTPEDRQPPIRISALLNEQTRDKLGIKVNHLVRGPLPTTILIKRDETGAQSMSLEADLSGTELIFGNMGWTKPKGKQAAVGFDIVKAKDGSTELANLKITGDDIAITGSMFLDPEQRLKSFNFSDFSFDILTHVQIAAMVREGNILDVRATGASYNGKQFFQSLFSAGQLAENAPPEPDDVLGINLSARIDTVVGFYDTTLKDVQVTLQKRGGKLVALDIKGALNGDAQVAVKLDHEGSSRVIKAECRDAGAAFRLVGFYPSIAGGEASLQVNLDAGDVGSKSGTLWVRNFELLGDAVVSDVLADPNTTAALGRAPSKRQADRVRIGFRQLRAPFSVGGGKFRLNDAYMNGPQLGATMRGSVDFKTQTVDLGGTYVPAYGLNAGVLGAIPVFGKVLTGRQGEGLIGITFTVQGKLDDPAVLVNPMSVLTPGIFRQIFEGGGQARASEVSPAVEPPFGMTTP
jgi:hypothetical protein